MSPMRLLTTAPYANRDRQLVLDRFQRPTGYNKALLLLRKTQQYLSHYRDGANRILDKGKKPISGSTGANGTYWGKPRGRELKIRRKKLK